MSKRKYDTFDGDFGMCLTIFLALSTIVCFLPSILVSGSSIDFTESGQIGDTIGGIMGPFVAIIAAGLTFFAFWVQYKANIMQRKDISIERFERNFFDMLNLHESITNSLVLEEINVNRSDDRFRQEGRDVFQMLYEICEIKVNKSVTLEHYGISKETKYKGLKNLFKEELDAFDFYVKETAVCYLDHYFRQLYWIFKYIDESTELTDEDKYMYACIVRSTLSQYELVVLFYNCLSENGIDNFKPLIEKYSLMNNLRVSLLARPEDKESYGESAYKHRN